MRPALLLQPFFEGFSALSLIHIFDQKQYLAKKSVWIFGGDGWAYDIGFGGLDHVLARCV